MNSIYRLDTAPRTSIYLLTALLFVFGGMQISMAEENGTNAKERLSISTFRAPGAEQSVVKTMRKKLDDKTAADSRSREKPAAGGNKAQKHDGHVWVDYASVGLSSDLDGDGYYTRISLDFDVDTDYLITDVYARLFLSLEQGPWVEYAATDNFAVQAIGGDSYYVDTDLVEGFPPGYYDLRIEVYDAVDDYLLATYGPRDSAEVTLLPLEDEFEDDVFVNEPVGVITISDSGGGGSFGGLAMLALVFLMLMNGVLRKKARAAAAIAERAGADTASVKRRPLPAPQHQRIARPTPDRSIPRCPPAEQACPAWRIPAARSFRLTL